MWLVVLLVSGLELRGWRVVVLSSQSRAKVLVEALTPRRRQVLEQVARGKTNAEIGRALFITENSVKTHLKILGRVWGVSARAELVARAIRAGLLE